jgi:hypothetical protein
MLDTHLPSLKEVDPVLSLVSDFHKESLVLATLDISCVGVSLSCAVVASYIRLERHESCHKYT